MGFIKGHQYTSVYVSIALWTLEISFVLAGKTGIEQAMFPSLLPTSHEGQQRGEESPS